MPLTIPDRKSLALTGQAYTRTNVPEWDPSTSRRSFIGGLVRSLMMALHDWYVALKLWTDVQAWPQTASEDFFKRGWWLDITNLPRNPATAASGRVLVTGSAGSILPAGTPMTANGATYSTLTATTVVTQTLTGVSSVFDNRTGQFVTSEPHELATGLQLTFSGMSDTALNGTFPIEVIDATTIRFRTSALAGANPLSPNPRASGTWATVIVTAGVTGPTGNLDSGGSLSISSPPSGMDGTAIVCFDGVADGSDLETLEAWRGRVLAALGTDYGMFSEDEIKQVASTVPGVTRVFVRRPTRQPTAGYPLEGQVRVSFLRENDADPIPSALEVSQVRDKIYGQLVPAHMVPEDCEILAPERYGLEIRFQSITPDTPGMRASIEANLRQFLKEEAGWGGTLEVEALRCAIRAGVDASTGTRLARYQLSTPTTDIALPVDAYPVMTGITWSE